MYQERINVCANCKFCVDTLVYNEILKTKYWCGTLNIPIVEPDRTGCDSFKNKNRKLNAWNFRRITTEGEENE